jgi:hypothetical protein
MDRYGNGDGTVNQRSLEVCHQWKPENNAGHEVNVTALNGADHMSILSDVRKPNLNHNLVIR